jgi:hypothetical protein
MSDDIAKILTGIVAVALVTSLVLKNRKTAQVLTTAGGIFDSALNLVITGN